MTQHTDHPRSGECLDSPYGISVGCSVLGVDDRSCSAAKTGEDRQRADPEPEGSSSATIRAGRLIIVEIQALGAQLRATLWLAEL